MYKFQIDRKRNEHARSPTLTILKSCDFYFKKLSYCQNNNSGIMVIELLYKFQIDRKRNEHVRVPTSNCFGMTDGMTESSES